VTGQSILIVTRAMEVAAISERAVADQYGTGAG
jgi:hypothetical protein